MTHICTHSSLYLQIYDLFDFTRLCCDIRISCGIQYKIKSQPEKARIKTSRDRARGLHGGNSILTYTLTL